MSQSQKPCVLKSITKDMINLFSLSSKRRKIKWKQHSVRKKDKKKARSIYIISNKLCFLWTSINKNLICADKLTVNTKVSTVIFFTSEQFLLKSEVYWDFSLNYFVIYHANIKLYISFERQFCLLSISFYRNR